MIERQDIIRRLRRCGALAGIQWAYESAIARTLADWVPTAGYDATLLGMMVHTLLCDRLDRVFSTGNYAIGLGGTDDAGLDLVFEQLSPREREAMPKLPSTLVERDNLNGSPGWAVAGNRFLLQSAPIDKLGMVPWATKRPTKQMVARQPDPEPDLGMLAELAGADELRDALQALRTRHGNLDKPTFVLAHALDGDTGRRQLMLGRPAFNDEGRSWHWLENLLTTPPPRPARSGEPVPPTGPDGVPDAVVKMRRDVDKRKADER